MKSIRSSKLGYYNTILLLQEADELARSRKWTRSFALYVLYYQEITTGEMVRAEAWMKLLEKEVLGALTNPGVLEHKREYGEDRGANCSDLD
jgi:hypothetical protein